MRTSVYNTVRVIKTLNFAAIATDTTTNSTGVDLSQYQNYNRAATLLLVSGAVTDGSFTFAVEESDNNSDWVAVAASNLQGATPTWTSASDNIVAEVGVIPTKRYLRVAVTSASTSSGGIIGAYFIVGDARREPIARA